MASFVDEEMVKKEKRELDEEKAAIDEETLL